MIYAGPPSGGQTLRKYSGLSPDEYRLWLGAPRHIAAKSLGSDFQSDTPPD